MQCGNTKLPKLTFYFGLITKVMFSIQALPETCSSCTPSSCHLSAYVSPSRSISSFLKPPPTLQYSTVHHNLASSSLIYNFLQTSNTSPIMATDRDRTLADRVADRVVDRTHGQQLQVHPQLRFDGSGGGAKNFFPEHGPTAGQVLAVLTGLPVGGTLLALSGFTLLVTLIGLALAAPLFVIFSPIIVPAVVVIGLAVTAILTAGAFGITALSSLSWVVNSIREAIYVRQGEGILPVEEAKRRVQDMTNYVGQKTKDLGQGIQNTAHTGIGVGSGDRDRRST